MLRTLDEPQRYVEVFCDCGQTRPSQAALPEYHHAQFKK
jgi:hypothetical protein